MTLTALLIQSAGLSEKDAAHVLKTNRETVRKWLKGEIETPERVTKELYSILDLEQHAANYVVDLIRKYHPTGEVKVCVSNDAILSQIQGWPALGMMNAAARRFFEIADDDIRSRTRVVHEQGLGAIIFGIRLRPDGTFAELDDPPEPDEEDWQSADQ